MCMGASDGLHHKAIGIGDQGESLAGVRDIETVAAHKLKARDRRCRCGKRWIVAGTGGYLVGAGGKSKECRDARRY